MRKSPPFGHIFVGGITNRSSAYTQPHLYPPPSISPTEAIIIMFWAVLKPWALMGFSTGYLLITIARLVSAGDFSTLLSWEKFGEAWFGNFWKFMGPRSKAEAERWVVPLLEGRIHGGRASATASNPPIDGLVLEVGAGSGMWAQVLANITWAAKSSSGGGPTKIYGVEPNPISAAALKQRVDETGMTGTYEVVPVGIEDMHKETSIEPGSVDCIMTVQCLCSIPEPEKNIQLLYNYLKKGGRWYLYEHVRANRGLVIPVFQSKFNKQICLMV